MDSNDVLFAIKKENLETGLRGVPVGYCTTSTVDPEKGLFYAGKPVAELAYKTPEEVIYLLYHGREASSSELETFKKELISRSRCSDKALKAIKSLPKEVHPMSLFSAALLILGGYECTNDYREDCLNLIAKLPEITATLINSHAGWKETPPSRPELGYMQNFAHMLQIPHQASEHLGEIFTLFNILHFDHGGGNLSTFVGKAVASGLADLYTSIAAGMDALSGPRHGRANQECLLFVEEIFNQVGPNAKEEDVEKVIREKLAKKELIYGFGHAVLRVEDPRATVQYSVAEKYYKDHPLVKTAFLIRKAGTKVLKENPKIADPYPNVDAISGTLFTAAGFPFPEYYTVLFGLSRAVGISIQIVYERCEARDKKGTPIMRPKYIYKGKTQ